MSELPITTNPRTIISEVGAWARRQPWGEDSGKPSHAPDYGVVEELGECVHAILKNMQGIRGMDDPVKFREAITDGIGDAMVYLSHWCYLKNAYYTFDDKVETPETLRHILIQLLINLSRLLTLSHGYGIGAEQPICVTVATTVARNFQQMATYLGYDVLTDCLVPTWHKVKMRDWNKNKLKGGE